MRSIWAIPLSVAVGCAGDGDGSDTTPSGGDGIEVPTSGTPYDRLPIQPNFRWEDGTVNGRHVMYYAPEDPPRGVLFAFHGNEGGITTVTQEEWIDLYNLLVPVRMALVLTESLDRVEQAWDNTAADSNPDWQQLVDVRQWMIDNTTVDEDTPVVGVGFSNGATFVQTFSFLALAADWPVRTFVAHQSHTSSPSSVPGMFISAENDFDAGLPEDVQVVADKCTEALGTECPHVHGTEIPLDPRRFARIPAYDLTMSANLFNEMVDLGLVDQDGARLVDVADVDSVVNWYIANSQGPSPSLPPTQFRVVWATHRFSSQHAYEEAVWLSDHL